MRAKLNIFGAVIVLAALLSSGCSKEGINPLSSSSEEAKAWEELQKALEPAEVQLQATLLTEFILTGFAMTRTRAGLEILIGLLIPVK